MNQSNKGMQKILIVDDSEMNRAILSEMLGSEYEILEAEDGVQAVAILQKHSAELSLVLLDIVMPVMDGYEVLAVMNSNHWIESIPVIMISTESALAAVDRAYELGVTDFISRPFDALIVRRRVVNTILLYAKQRRLEGLAADQIYEKEKNSNLMIAILSHIVEFRNGESGLHVLHVQNYTEILLRTLVQLTDKYRISSDDITLISNASALHDIGKISIADEILNKPGRLTAEEFEIMKTHSAVGAAMISQLSMYQNEPLVARAYEICRWHHERYDGRGYPDGLLEDEIPIAAQVVALSDVYDALTSERVYKKAFSHETALAMIMNGECGTFNPILLDCLRKAEDEIRKVKDMDLASYNSERELKCVSDEMLRYSELAGAERTLSMLRYERMKSSFFNSISEELCYEYTVIPSMVTFSSFAAGKLGVREFIMNPLHSEELQTFVDSADMERISAMLHNTTPQQPVVQSECCINYQGQQVPIRVICSSVWSSDEVPQYMGSIGKGIRIGQVQVMQEAIRQIRLKNIG